VTLRPGTLAPSGDQATVAVVVAVDVADAFEVFTQEIDRWWKRGPRYRIAGHGPGVLQFEAGVGGRLFETFETAAGAKVFEVGRVTAWEPPSRLVLEWRNANFAPSERTEIEVLFEPAGGGTRVTVQHRGWAALRPDHPARHNLAGSVFSRMIGLWWGEQLTALRELAEGLRS
jgi:uncharacterized protein YndB with AHSA1/START domain